MGRSMRAVTWGISAVVWVAAVMAQAQTTPDANGAAIQSLVATVPGVRPEFLYRRARELMRSGATVESLERAGADPSKLLLDYVKEVEATGWHRESAALILEYLNDFAAPSPARRAALEAAMKAALVANADACLAYPNTDMARRAVAACEARLDPAVDAAELTRLRAKLAAAYPSYQPAVPITVDGVVSGPAAWQANPAGYTIDGLVQIGNDANSRGGKWIEGKVKATDGFVMNRGTIRTSGGSLTFEGTPERPVILRDVLIECDYTAAVHARNTIFVRCAFHKSGSWFWNNGYSSKWDFDHCLLLDSSFGGLWRLNYGIKLDHCAFVGCTFPRRDWTRTEAVRSKGEDDDAAKQYRNDWGKVEECDFHDCDVSPSFAWTTRRCNFTYCRVTDTGAFVAKTNLEAELGFAEEELGTFNELVARTTPRGQGRVGYTRPPGGLFPREGASSLWQYLDDDVRRR